MKTASLEKSLSLEHLQAMKDYKECLKSNPYLSFKSYCEDNTINYKKILAWMHRRGISLKLLQVDGRGQNTSNDINGPTFIQFRPQSHPFMPAGVLQCVSITFPNNISLTLQECTVESLMSLLFLYHPEK